VARTPSNTDVEFWRDPELHGVELRLARYRESTFGDHTHTTYSIGLIDDGRTSFSLSGGDYRAGLGQMVVIEPSKSHSCNPDPGETMGYRMFYLDAEWLAEDTSGVRVSFSCPVIDDPELFAEWSDLFELVRSAAPVGDKRDAIARAVSRLIDEHADTDRTFDAPADLQAVEIAKSVLSERLAERVTLVELAEQAGVSRSHLSRAFRASEKLPPHRYQNQLRVQLAKEMLLDGGSPGDVAVETGFSDQSHFSRVFREFTGATPVQYQQTDGD
jgi:AraC-like DNA-binding protein